MGTQLSLVFFYLLQELKQVKGNAQNSRPSSSSSNTSSATPGKNEAPSASYPNSPSRSRSIRHQHQHSHSEPVPPSPSETSLPPRAREDHSRERRHEQAMRREQESRQREERRRSEERHRNEERRRSEERRCEQERRYDQERRRERRQGERGYRDHLQVAMSQQHSVRNHHSQQLPGAKERGYLSQQRQHSDSRLEPPPPPQYRSQQRRESRDSHRRRSADPSLLQQHFDSPISPPMFRHSLVPAPHGPAPHQEHLHFRRDSAGSAADETEFGSQASLLASPARHTGDRAPRFEEGSGDETGCSQPWGEPLCHTDIQISIQDLGVPHSTAPSSARLPHHPTGPLHLYHAQSQEQFIDDDEFGGVVGGGGGRTHDPMFYDDSHAHHHFKASDMPSHTSALSQPVHSTRRRLQSSVPDLSLLTSSNLAQGLSQSVLDMSRQRGSGGDHASGLRPHHDVARSNGAHRLQTYHSHLNRMPSDPHLNGDGGHHPGLARTLLARLKEEPEHSPAVHRRRTRGGAVGGASSSSQRRGYRNRRRTPSPSPAQQQESSQTHSPSR